MRPLSSRPARRAGQQLNGAGTAVRLRPVGSEIMNIRIARNQDRDDVQRVHLCAFPEGEGEIVSKLTIDLLSEKTTPRTISLVAETDGAIVGHIAFSPVIIADNENFQGYILAPLGVKPDFHKRRIGSRLINPR